MERRMPRASCALLALFVVVTGAQASTTTKKVTNVSPKEASLGGNSRLTVIGEGFSPDQFTLTETQNVGNVVYLVGTGGQSLETKIHLDECTETSLSFYTPKGMVEDMYYSLSVKVDGVFIDAANMCADNPQNCMIRARNSTTPTIDWLQKPSGKPGDMITLRGNIFTTRYGSNIDVSENGNEQFIKRLRAPTTCMLKDGDNFYGLSLDSNETNYGTMTCKTTGTFVGNVNVTYILDMGQSLADMKLLKVSRNGSIYMFQYYTDISSISPSQSGIEGGIPITISGSYYQDGVEGYHVPEVKVGGVDCEDIIVDPDVKITCTVPKQPPALSSYPGNRGAFVEYWDSLTVADDAEALATTTQATGVAHIDQSNFCGEAYNLKRTRLTFIFISTTTSDFTFSVSVTNGGSLYLNGSLVATSTGAWADGANKVAITAGYYNKIVVVAAGGSDPDACVKVRGFQTKSDYTSMMTGFAIAETQVISLTSTVEYEEMDLTLSGFSSSSPTSEKQTVCLESGSTYIQLGLFGVFTETVDMTSSSLVQAALNKLPFVESGESFTVAENQNCLDITFISKRGDIPNFECDSSHTITVTEATKGTPDNGYFSFIYGGVPSPLILYSSNATEDIKNALDTMFSALCPSMFEPTAASYNEGYESSPSASTEIPAFCGKNSRKNPWALYEPIRPVNLAFLNYRYMCLALNGHDAYTLYLKYNRVRGIDTATRWKGVALTFLAADGAQEVGWNYTCVDLLTNIQNQAGNAAGDSFSLVGAYIGRANDMLDVYVDSVIVGPATLEAVVLYKKQVAANGNMRNLRLGPALPNTQIAPFSMDQVTVTLKSADTYTVELRPNDCAYDFDLIQLAASEVTAGSLSSDAATMTLSGGTGSLAVTRSKKASKPVTGPYKLNFNGSDTEEIQGDHDDSQIKNVLEASFPEILGRVDVERTRASTCANMDIKVTMKDTKGDQPQMTVASSTLSPASAAITVTTETDGALLYDPFPGDMITTSHDNPQVQVYINSVPAICDQANNDCSFTWSQASTPTVSSISPMTGTTGNTLTVTGTLFSTVVADNKVFIGNVECAVSSASTTQLECTLANGPAGASSVRVWVANKGWSTGSASFTFEAGSGSINPVEDGHGGGATLTLTGSGFSSLSTVSVGGADCPITGTVTASQITCTVPIYSQAVDGSDYQVDVVVTSDGSTAMATTLTFTYKSSLTAVITSVSATELSVAGGETVTMAGRNLGSSVTVFLQTIAMNVTSSSATEIVFVTPQPLTLEGEQEISVLADGVRRAIVHSTSSGRRKRNTGQATKPAINVNLWYNSFSPSGGSLYGGTVVTIGGDGYGTDKTKVEVKMGPHYNCDVTTVTNTEITCQIASTITTHRVTNEGKTGYGMYYAFNVTDLVIEVGDRILWTWTTPTFITETIKHGIYQIDSLATDTPKANGFAVSAPSRDGSFQYQFMVAGVYYVQSGFVDAAGLRNYKMKITVTARTSKAEDLSLKAHGVSATLKSTGSSVSASCSINTPLDSGCTPLQPVTGKFNFDSCYTPVINSISFTDASNLPHSVASDTQLDFAGAGLSSTSCKPEVKLGSCDCNEMSASGTNFVCTPVAACFSTIGTMQQTSLALQPYGFAYLDIPNLPDRSVAFIPTIKSITPNTGSTEGGTPVEITGDGIDASSLLTIDGFAATQISNSNGKWTWETPAGTLGYISLTTKGFTAKCLLTQCRFSYSASETPTITSTSLSGSTVTFIGQNFQTDMTILLGGSACSNLNVASGQVSCDVVDLTAGVNSIIMKSASKGNAKTNGNTVTGSLTVSTVSLSQGSTNGGTVLEFTGSGFFAPLTTVVSTDGSSVCDVNEFLSTHTSLVCTTDAHAAGPVNFKVTTNSIPATNTPQFTFDTSVTPTITSISPSTGSLGTDVVIAGSGFSGTTSNVYVWLDNDSSGCTVTSVTSTSISCTITNQVNKVYDLKVDTDDGYSNTKLFTYTFQATSIDPTSGDELGGQRLTVQGSGFTENGLSVTVCGKPCTQSTVSSTEYVCITPAKDSVTACDVEITDGQTSTTPGTYTYAAGVAPTVTNVTPTRGGTAGGTSVTITGTGFDSPAVVTIAGITCAITDQTTTQITCTTGAHSGTVSSKIDIAIGNKNALQAPDFYYIDAWSSVYTWGGTSLPQADEFIVIGKGKVVLLDITTPILSFLLIQGGELIFDEKDLTLNARTILITDGGKLMVGSELSPFEHKATIQMHGHNKEKELPIYGNKVLAVRNGTLGLFGKKVYPTWALLDGTVSAGATSITLKVPVVGWQVGDSIIIATTGKRASLEQNEQRKIVAISADGRTITLDSPLQYQHFGEDETHTGPDGQQWTLQIRAEVGLLSRNVLFRGNDDPTWHGDITACADGFDTGEFVVQTCFQGRFGDDKTDSQFGAHILIHAPEKHKNIAKVHLEYVELYYVGQAFRLGRYPIHFHLNGDMQLSYVIGCSIHHSFNRAVNIHFTNYVRIAHNVVYDIMGGALFLEDGIETGNVFEYNLAVYVVGSTSLLNDDITPAAIWLTNPNNTVRHNHCASGTHFCIWMKLNSHPIGPSATTTICPKHVPLGIFLNNTAHSMGWFGIWIFPDYFPQKLGSCSTTDNPEPAILKEFFVWNCEKGAETVVTAAVQFMDSIFAQNDKAGFEGKTLKDASPCHEDLSSKIENCLFVGQFDNTAFHNTDGMEDVAVVTPFSHGLFVKKCTFVNYNVVFTGTKMDGTCGSLCNGHVVFVMSLNFVNVVSRVWFKWLHHITFVDTDGSLCGVNPGTGLRLFANSPNINFPSTCNTNCNGIKHSAGFDVIACPMSHKPHKLGFNQIQPTAYDAKLANFVATVNGNTLTTPGAYAFKRFEHKNGWSVVLLDGYTYRLTFEGASSLSISNMSFTGTVYDFEKDECIIIEFVIATEPDVVSIDGGSTTLPKNATKFDCTTVGVQTGNWYYLDTDKVVGLALTGDVSRTPQLDTKCGAVSETVSNIPLSLVIMKCLYTGCIPPPDPSTVPPLTQRPSPYQLFHQVQWDKDSNNVVHTSTNGSHTLVDGEDLTVDLQYSTNDKWWVVFNKDSLNAGSVTKLGTVTLKGTLEIDYAATNVHFQFEMKFLIIMGGRFVAGWIDNPMLSEFTLTMTGSTSTPIYPMSSGTPVGRKAIASYGGLDIHGRSTEHSWVKLSVTAAAGSVTLNLAEDVSLWSAGDEVVVTSTAYDSAQTERKTIQSVNAKVVTLTTVLAYAHTVSTVDGVIMAAAVGLLTRNVRVKAQDNGENLGGRILVSTQQDGDTMHKGYGKFSNVQFINFGQIDYIDPTDCRAAIAFVNLGDIDSIRPSYVTDCSFEDLYNSAICVYGANKLNITNNVVYKPTGPGIVTASSESRIENNLVTTLQWTGTALGRSETFNFRFDAGIDAIGSSDLQLKDNMVAGSQRAGYALPGESCTAISKYSNNHAMGCLMGIIVLPHDEIQTSATSDCVMYSGFVIWKNYDYGLYYQNSINLLVKGNTFADNKVGLFPMVLGPDPLTHTCTDNYVKVEDNRFIGAAGTCSKGETISSTLPYMSLSSSHRAASLPGNLQTGLYIAIISSGSNKCASKPCLNIMAYNTICGHMEITSNNFHNYAETCAVPISNSPTNDDLNHPVEVKSCTFHNTPGDNRIMITRPNLGKINPSDCVDMDCDAMKKTLITDLDGSMMGVAGSYIPESEWQYNGNPSNGLGDYRIPAALLTASDGTKLSVDSVVPYKGIVRGSNCVAVNKTTHAHYKCPGSKYTMMVIESMDEDTELRRLSPVAIVIDRFIDLINGPQDHGWCSGYTCQKRVSLFHALIETGKKVEIYLSSTPPTKTRLFLLNAETSDCSLVAFYLPVPERIDIHIPTGYIVPNNGDLNNGRLVFKNEQNVDYKPSCASSSHGSNYIDRDNKMIYVILKGTDWITMTKTDQFVVKFGFPSLTADEFFNSNIVQNIAVALGIGLEKVRVVNVVSESTATGRRKRSTSTLQVTLECGDPPSSTSAASSVESMALQASKIMTYCQSGAISTQTGQTGTTCDQISYTGTIYTPAVPEELRFHTATVPQHEGTPFATQPKIRAYDSNGDVIDHLGLTTDPWVITAVLRAGTGHANATLTGTLVLTSENGWFNFTDLEISHAGSGYIIDFTITYPTGMENLTIASDPITLPGRPLTAGVHSMTTGTIPQNTVFAITLDIRDGTTDEVITDITWRGHTFDVTCNLTMAMKNSWALAGTLTKTFDPSTGRAEFDDLSFTGYGIIYIGCKTESTPSEYSFYSYHEAVIIGSHQQSIPSEATNVIVRKFDVDYATYIPNDAAKYQLLSAVSFDIVENYPDVILKSAVVSEGSILVTFTITGASVNITSVTQSMCTSTAEGSTVTVGGTTLTYASYMTVDGTDYYSTCASGDDDDDDDLHAGFIALIVIAIVLFIILVVLLMVYFLKIKPKTKTHGVRRWTVTEYPGKTDSGEQGQNGQNTQNTGGFYYIDNGRTVFLAGANMGKAEGVFKQKVEMFRPTSAAPISTLYDTDSGYNVRKSPNLTSHAEGLTLERTMTPTGH